MLKIIWVTHCSREKDPRFKDSGETTTPDRLYTSPALQQFIIYCQAHGFDWAIFSDKYGVVFPQERIAWYNKPTESVTNDEFEALVESFTSRLAEFDTIHFYHRPGETHPVFQRVVELAREKGLKIVEFSMDEAEQGA